MMKSFRSLVSLILPLTAVAVIYSQVTAISLGGLPTVTAPPAKKSNAEVASVTDTNEVVNVKTWEETVRKSGRRR